MPYFIKAGAPRTWSQYNPLPLVAALIALAALFSGALWFQSRNAAAATVLFDCFKVLFTASLALFGFEAHRSG
jgi:hypothetical protein